MFNNKNYETIKEKQGGLMMKLGTFLALLDNTEDNHKILDYIHSIIDENEAHIRGLWGASSPDYQLSMMGQGLPVAVTDKIVSKTMEESQKNEHFVESLFETWCQDRHIAVLHSFAYENIHQNHGVTASFVSHIGKPLEAIARLGRVSDFIVASRKAWSYSEEQQDKIHAALFETARPVILLPPDNKAKPIENIAIAWNGKAEASHAVARAKPFLKQAKKIWIYIAPSERTSLEQGSDLAFYLSQHGVIAQIVEIERENHHNNVGEAIHEQAVADNIDLLIMGAWSRSRLRQLVLGGLTNYMLQKAEFPVMMAR